MCLPFIAMLCHFAQMSLIDIESHILNLVGIGVCGRKWQPQLYPAWQVDVLVGILPNQEVIFVFAHSSSYNMSAMYCCALPFFMIITDIYKDPQPKYGKGGCRWWPMVAECSMSTTYGSRVNNPNKTYRLASLRRPILPHRLHSFVVVKHINTLITEAQYM